MTNSKFQTPLALNSHKSGLKNYSNKNYHIFRKPLTSAFRWHTLDTSEKCSNLRKKRFRLHSFGPVWTISTGNQWEISEFGRLSCFSDIFVWFHIRVNSLKCTKAYTICVNLTNIYSLCVKVAQMLPQYVYIQPILTHIGWKLQEDSRNMCEFDHSEWSTHCTFFA